MNGAATEENRPRCRASASTEGGSISSEMKPRASSTNSSAASPVVPGLVAPAQTMIHGAELAASGGAGRSGRSRSADKAAALGDACKRTSDFGLKS